MVSFSRSTRFKAILPQDHSISLAHQSSQSLWHPAGGGLLQQDSMLLLRRTASSPRWTDRHACKELALSSFSLCWFCGLSRWFTGIFRCSSTLIPSLRPTQRWTASTTWSYHTPSSRLVRSRPHLLPFQVCPHLEIDLFSEIFSILKIDLCCPSNGQPLRSRQLEHFNL